MKNFKLTPVKENLKLENKNSESDLNFKNPVSNFMNCMTRLVQVSINYGINKSSLNSTAQMTLLEKTLFLLHNSIFLQLTFLLCLLTTVFIIIHYKCKKHAETSLARLKLHENHLIEDSDKLPTGDENKMSNEDLKSEHFYPGRRKEDMVLKIESKKFDKFLNVLENSFVANKRN